VIVNAPISVGELIDKITILKIKSILIKDITKLKNIEQELQLLEELKDSLNINVDSLQSNLYGVNLELWHIENFKRECEKNQRFDDKFIESARQVYLKNDLRASLKKQINELVGSTIIEEKSY
jgi:hypothetical protein